MDIKKFNKTILILCLCLVFSIFHLLSAATFTVNTFADTVDVNPGDGTAADADGHCSLRAAIMEANALYGPDTIVLPAGTFKITLEGSREDRCETGDLDIFSNLTIRGAGMYETTIDGNRGDRVFDISGKVNVSIFGLAVANGQAPDGRDGTRENINGGDGEAGGGIRNDSGSLSIENCKIINNCAGSGGGGYQPLEGINGSGHSGGGIFTTDGELYLSNCIVCGNRAGSYGRGGFDGYGGDGGGIYSRGTLLIDRCTIRRNRAGSGWDYTRGGGMCQAGHMEIKDSNISNNTGASQGGGLFISGEASIAGTTISGNETTGFGGGIYVDPFSDEECSISNCTICGNVGEFGGGIAAAMDQFDQSNTRITNTIIASNIGDPDGNGADCCGVLNSRAHNLIGNIEGYDTTGN